MIDSGLEFGYPSHFTNSILEDRFELLLSLQLWNTSFLSHKLTYDNWVTSSKYQTDQSVSNETNSNILGLLQEASNIRSISNLELNEVSIKKLLGLQHSMSLTISLLTLGSETQNSADSLTVLFNHLIPLKNSYTTTEIKLTNVKPH